MKDDKNDNDRTKDQIECIQRSIARLRKDIRIMVREELFKILSDNPVKRKDF